MEVRWEFVEFPLSSGSTETQPQQAASPLEGEDHIGTKRPTGEPSARLSIIQISPVFSGTQDINIV